jgi:hypothetical protein
MSMTIYLVRCTDPIPTADWWSNESGWSSIGDAVVFTEEERHTLNLPIGGEWVAFIIHEEA